MVIHLAWFKPGFTILEGRVRLTESVGEEEGDNN